MDVIKWDMSIAYRCFERAAKSDAIPYGNFYKGKKGVAIKAPQTGEWENFKSGVNKGIAKKRG